MKKKKPQKHDNITITAKQPDRMPSEMDTASGGNPPLRPSENPQMPPVPPEAWGGE